MSERTPALDFTANVKLRQLVRLDIGNRDAHPELLTLTKVASVLCKNIGTISGWYNSNVPMPSAAIEAVERWIADDMRAGAYWLMPTHGKSFGDRGEWIKFRRIMDGPGYVLRYHEAAAILGLNQWTVYAWYWNITQVPEQAIAQLRAFRKDFPHFRSFPRKEAMEYAAPAYRYISANRNRRTPRKQRQ